MKSCFILLLVTILSISVYSQNYKQVKIFINDIEDVHKLEQIGLEFDHPHINKDNSFTVFLRDDEMNLLTATGYRYDILINDWFQYFESQPTLTEIEKQQFISNSKESFNVEGFGFGTMGGYYTLNEVLLELDSMKMLYPNLITIKQSIGTSIEGRPIYMVKISDNPDITENEPRVLYTSLHHAREPQGMMQMIYFMYYLLENYGTNAEATHLINNREMYFIPVVNPDGYEYNRSTNPNGGGMWRKNRRNNGSAFGVDLNRNYGPMAYWDAPNGGSSTSPSSDTYRGTAPFSEPETSALRDFLFGKGVKNTLNYHTYSNLLIYPYGALSNETPDSLIFREYASDMTVYNGYVYGTDMQTVGYSTRGNSDDYMYDGDTISNGGKVFAMTPEVGSSSDGFWPAQSRIFPLAQENVFPNLYYAWVAGAYVGLVDPGYSEQYFDPGDVISMNSIFRNKGLSEGQNIQATLSSLSPYITINNGSSSTSSIPARGTAQLSTPFSFTVSASAPIDVEAKLLVNTSSGGVQMRADTLKLFLGTPIFVFADTTNEPLNLWTITATPTTPKWEATNTQFYSSPVSYTDSKTGQYVSNATVTMTMTNPIDITSVSNPRLSFWTKFDIESNWDYGQVEVSTNNGTTWIALQGLYTEPASGTFQPSGQPVYDGTKNDWVREQITLSSYQSSQLKLRFKLRTDGSVTKDGWYIDDIAISYYGVIPVELNSFTAKSSSKSINLNWITGSELNNSGFEVQRSLLEKNSPSKRKWEKIGFIEGKGTTTEKSNYNFSDKNPIEGKSFYRLKQIDFNGSFTYHNEAEIDFAQILNYSIEQNYPNPFNPSTLISFTIPNSEFVSIKVYNVLGSEIASLVSEFRPAGKHQVEFNAENLGSGIYFYTISSGNFNQTRKMLLVK